MNTVRPSLLFVLSVILAIFVPLSTAVKAHFVVKVYPSIKVKIEGYDPRDLFYGHYLVYRPVWNLPENEKGIPVAGECLCVAELGDDPPIMRQSCYSPALQQCAATIKLVYGSEIFDGDTGRFYIDESLAHTMETLLREDKHLFQLEIFITPSGTPQIGDLYVDGKPFREFIRDNPGTKVSAPTF